MQNRLYVGNHARDGTLQELVEPYSLVTGVKLVVADGKGAEALRSAFVSMATDEAARAAMAGLEAAKGDVCSESGGMS